MSESFIYPISASNEMWIPRDYFPPQHRLRHQAATSLYFEKFTATKKSESPITLAVDRISAVHNVVFKQHTSAEVEFIDIYDVSNPIVHDYVKRVAMTGEPASDTITVLKSVVSCAWGTFAHSSPRSAFEDFIDKWRQAIDRDTFEVNETDRSIRVNAYVSVHPVMIPVSEQDIVRVRERKYIEYIADWGKKLWGEIAFRLERVDIRPGVATIALPETGSFATARADGFFSEIIRTALYANIADSASR